MNHTETLIKDFLGWHALDGPNFDETPRRVATMWERFLYNDKVFPELKTFPTENREPVIMRGHIAWGFCPHHLLPVRYTFTIGYIPNGRVVGISKLARLAEYYVKELPLQEDLTVLIANTLFEKLDPFGAVCGIKGYHLCSVMRGIKSEDVSIYTVHHIGEDIAI